jgi:hypothetical protein
MRPAFGVARALRRVGTTAMGQAQQGAAVPIDQLNLDQTRSRRHLLIAVPTKAVGEPVRRQNLAELGLPTEELMKIITGYWTTRVEKRPIANNTFLNM